MKESSRKMVRSAPAGPFYFLGFIGSLVYYVDVAHGFGSVVLAVLKSFVWPAFLVHDLLRFIG